jgi:MerR family transcriptional regulator, light-induced transcriptional regulator
MRQKVFRGTGMNLSTVRPAIASISKILSAPLTVISSALYSNGLKKILKNSQDPAPPDDCKQMITSVIDDQIIPRLLHSHQIDTHQHESKAAARQVTGQEISDFAWLCINNDSALCHEFVDRLLDGGLTNENIFLDLITPAARFLGRQWEEDLYDFGQVTNGLIRMHEITHRLGYEYQDGPQKAGENKRIMLACAPGSQHILGLTILSEIFRKEGWQVVVEISSSGKELLHAVANEWFDVIGISVATEFQLAGLDALVANMKLASQNKALAVMLGGPIFTIQQHTAAAFHANEICTDAAAAVKLALLMTPARPVR